MWYGILEGDISGAASTTDCWLVNFAEQVLVSPGLKCGEATGRLKFCTESDTNCWKVNAYVEQQLGCGVMSGHGGWPCLCVTLQGWWLIVVGRALAATPLSRFCRHVIVTSWVPALRPPILDNGGVVFGGSVGFSSMLECAVWPVSLLNPGPALFVEKAHAVRCFLPRL